MVRQEEPRYLRAREAAKYLSISRSMLDKLRRKGIMPSIKVGRCRLYDTIVIRRVMEMDLKRGSEGVTGDNNGN